MSRTSIWNQMNLGTTFFGSNLRFEKELEKSRQLSSTNNSQNLDSGIKKNIQKKFKKSVQFFDHDKNDPNKIDFNIQTLTTKKILGRFTIQKVNLITAEINEEKDKDMEIDNDYDSTISINENFETEEVIKFNQLSINFSTNRTSRQKDINFSKKKQSTDLDDTE